MKRWIWVFVLVFIISNTATAQKELSDYYYVLVPQQFEFLKGKDQYQLNTLTRHLFKNAGFNALFQEELENFPRCEGLTAEVVSNSNMFFTRLRVILKDCENRVVFQSVEGTTKEKDYKKAYHQALRKAFQSIEMLQLKQKNLEELRAKPILVNQNTINRNTIANKVVIEQNTKNSTFEISENRYLFEGENYSLKKSAGTFFLYRKASGNNTFEEVGVLTPTSREGMYLFVSNGKSTLANFDTNDNLIIDTIDASGNTVQQIYTLEK
ncbi:MAG: hypothetical protein CVU03_04565 [Bacteroidetes bacterium HGW-Bacteroidetes-2]|jgi:hypothetical protein|nr:MAG: hypothetical protein CVU03_04565 [Bacteroidetes bacterium HGW-Bacteroidetes-2]